MILKEIVMINDVIEITELEVEIENKVKAVESKIVENKKHVSETERKRTELKKQIAELSKEIVKQRAKETKYAKEEKRYKQTRIKVHAGGMLDMTGLLRYVYPDDVKPDNPQDALIANLLVGLFLRIGNTLENANVDDLQKLWESGRDFRKQNINERVLPGVNKNLDALYKKLKLKLDETTTKLQPNDNDNSKTTSQKKPQQPNDNKTVS